MYKEKEILEACNTAIKNIIIPTIIETYILNSGLYSFSIPAIKTPVKPMPII